MSALFSVSVASVGLSKQADSIPGRQCSEERDPPTHGAYSEASSRSSATSGTELRDPIRLQTLK